MMGVPPEGPGKTYFHLTFVLWSNLSGKDSVVSEDPLKLGPLQLFQFCPNETKALRKIQIRYNKYILI